MMKWIVVDNSNDRRYARLRRWYHTSSANGDRLRRNRPRLTWHPRPPNGHERSDSRSRLCHQTYLEILANGGVGIIVGSRYGTTIKPVYTVDMQSRPQRYSIQFNSRLPQINVKQSPRSAGPYNASMNEAFEARKMRFSSSKGLEAQVVTIIHELSEMGYRVHLYSTSPCTHSYAVLAGLKIRSPMSFNIFDSFRPRRSKHLPVHTRPPHHHLPSTVPSASPPSPPLAALVVGRPLLIIPFP